MGTAAKVLLLALTCSLSQPNFVQALLAPSYRPSSFAFSTHSSSRLPAKAVLDENDRNHEEDNISIMEKRGSNIGSTSRRRFLLASTVAPCMTVALSQPTCPAHAQLVQFPCLRGLANTYSFLRVGTSLLEEQDIWSTNPLFLTNREDALSPRGEAQVVEACRQLDMIQENGGDGRPTIVKYSLAASAIDTANIIGRELKVGRDRLVPEFTYLDPRGIGAWDMTRKSRTEPAVWALDATEAGPQGRGGRPPPHTDGTPHETLEDQYVRLRQLISILETQYSGDTILLVFPDGTGPALLSCMIGGIPLHRVHELEFAPGELRQDMKYASVNALWQKRQANPNASYTQALREGSSVLQELRETSEYVNIKDQLYENEQKAIEDAYQAQRKLKLQQEQRDHQARLARQMEVAGPEIAISNTAVGAAGVAAIGGTVVSNIGSTSKSNEQRGKFELIAKREGRGSSSWLGSGKTVTAGAIGANGTIATALSKSSLSSFDPSAPMDLFGNSNGKGRTQVNNVASVIEETHANDGNSEKVDIPVQIDKVEAAEEAMEIYLNQDDGESAWLASVLQIIEEDDAERELTHE